MIKNLEISEEGFYTAEAVRLCASKINELVDSHNQKEVQIVDGYAKVGDKIIKLPQTYPDCCKEGEPHHHKESLNVKSISTSPATISIRKEPMYLEEEPKQIDVVAEKLWEKLSNNKHSQYLIGYHDALEDFKQALQQ